MDELACLKLSVLIWFVHIVVQAAFANAAMDVSYLSSARDQKREPRGLYYPRATRALHNFIENFVPFVAADLGLIVTNHAGGWGAPLWIVARIVYVPLYLTGASPGRSVAWGVSVLGLVMMLWRLAF